MRNFIEGMVVQNRRIALRLILRRLCDLIVKFQVFVFEIVRNEQQMVKRYEFNVNLIEGKTYQFS